MRGGGWETCWGDGRGGRCLENVTRKSVEWLDVCACMIEISIERKERSLYILIPQYPLLHSSTLFIHANYPSHTNQHTHSPIHVPKIPSHSENPLQTNSPNSHFPPSFPPISLSLSPSLPLAHHPFRSPHQTTIISISKNQKPIEDHTSTSVNISPAFYKTRIIFFLSC